jgi:hypothetical protein
MVWLNPVDGQESVRVSSRPEASANWAEGVGTLCGQWGDHWRRAGAGLPYHEARRWRWDRGGSVRMAAWPQSARADNEETARTAATRGGYLDYCASPLEVGQLAANLPADSPGRLGPQAGGLIRRA